MLRPTHVFISTIMVALFASVTTCQAHFLWVKTVEVDGKPQGFLFFGESPTEEAYHFPDKLKNVKLWSRAADGKRTEVATKSIDTDERVGLIGPLANAKDLVVETSQQYGIYGTALLVYHSKHVNGTDAQTINEAGTSKDLQLEIVPHVKGNDVDLTILWNGEPLPGAAVTVMVDGEDPEEKKADDKGHVSFKSAKGILIGALANTMEKDKTGELDKKSYKGVMHYASLTFSLPAKEGNASQKSTSKPADSKAEPPKTTTSALPPLPEAISSFGAAVADGWLYVYSGHTGEEHQHSAANLSSHFRRIKLDGGKEWEELPMQTHLQGMPLVAHGGKVYRVGGLNHRNATVDEKENLHSTNEFSQFDPATKKWTALASLPAARSSHNATVIGDKLYVVGGWKLDGKTPGTWQPDALVYDFNDPQSGWQKLPVPDFKRRALAAGVWDGKLVALGGMDENAKPSLRVDIFDPQLGKWSKGPKLPGVGMAGFGVSAWNLDGTLYVSGMRGVLYRLAKNGTRWEEAGKLETPRFFHQLVPGPQGSLLVVGGASMNGHLNSIEQLNPGVNNTAKATTVSEKKAL